jgi:hypothetical protein
MALDRKTSVTWIIRAAIVAKAKWKRGLQKKALQPIHLRTSAVFCTCTYGTATM